MTINTQKLLSLFDTAAQAHGWASDQGTMAQAQTALANYQRTRGDLEQALDAQAAEIARLRDALEWYSSMSKEMGNAAIHQDSRAMLTLMKEIAVDYGKRARAALAQEGS